MASLALTQRGHDVIQAASGDEALERLRHDRFELVISDLGLGPGKNGWELAEARNRGVDEVIAKPHRLADLRQVADRVAAGRDNE